MPCQCDDYNTPANPNARNDAADAATRAAGPAIWSQ